MREVAIIGATFYGNRGAEAMLSTTIGELRAEKSDEPICFHVFTYYPEKDRTLVDDAGIRIHSSKPADLVLRLLPCAILYRLFCLPGVRSLRRFLPDAVLSLARSKMLICLAGVSFVEGRGKFLPFNIATILPAMILGVPVVKFAQAMGPFKSTLNRSVSRPFLGACDRIFTRGVRTHGHLEELLSSKGNFERADDVAFLFRSEYCLSCPADGLEAAFDRLDSQRKAGQVCVGVCPSVVVAKRAEAAGWDYTQRMVDLITAVVVRGYAVALYPNATRGDDMDKTHNNDLPLLEGIVAKLLPTVRTQVVTFLGSLNASQIHRIINACDVHAVSRFHAMVAALSSCLPVLVIGWSHKYLEVMELFGQEDMVIDYKQGELAPVLAGIDRLITEKNSRMQSVSNALPHVRDLARRQLDYAVKLSGSAQ